MAFTAYVEGDKFPREITEMDTGKAVAASLADRGYEPQLYLATRPRRNGKGNPMVSMVIREKTSGNFVFAW